MNLDDIMDNNQEFMNIWENPNLSDKEKYERIMDLAHFVEIVRGKYKGNVGYTFSNPYGVCCDVQTEYGLDFYIGNTSHLKVISREEYERKLKERKV